MADHLAEHISAGCRCVDHALGFARMPSGYHLMLNHDQTHFYWLRASDGAEGYAWWNKWAAYRDAKSAATLSPRPADEESA